MTNKLSQSELETPAKVYQIVALENSISLLDEKLDTVISQTKGVVTNDQMATSIRNSENASRQYTDDAAEKIHLEYRPIKKSAIWLASIIIVALVGQFVALLLGVFNGSK